MHVRAEPGALPGDGTKFEDYFRSVGLRSQQPLDLSAFEVIDASVGRARRSSTSSSTSPADRLIEAFPGMTRGPTRGVRPHWGPLDGAGEDAAAHRDRAAPRPDENRTLARELRPTELVQPARRRASRPPRASLRPRAPAQRTTQRADRAALARAYRARPRGTGRRSLPSDDPCREEPPADGEIDEVRREVALLRAEGEMVQMLRRGEGFEAATVATVRGLIGARRHTRPARSPTRCWASLR